MPDVGDGTLPRLTVTPFAGDTAAVLTVYRGDDTTTVPAVASADGGATWLANSPVTYTVPGLWGFKWVTTGTGFGTELFTVNVTPDELQARRAWATTADLANWINTTVPADARRMLANATREVEDLIKHAVYDVDDDGEPTDTDVIAALKDAVCAAVDWWIKSGDEHGARSLYTSVSIGGTSLSRAATGPGGDMKIPAIGRAVGPILRRAGLLNVQPASW